MSNSEEPTAWRTEPGAGAGPDVTEQDGAPGSTGHVTAQDGTTRRHAVDLGIPGYRVEQEIGRGGFAVVYRATRVEMRQTVALKLLVGADRDQGALERFERERMALGALAHHPHIVTVYDGGITTDGTPYLAMECVRDGSLADRLRHSGPFAVDQVLDFGVKLAGAVETAHRAVVLHRDIKPENVLVTGYGQPLLADFGIAHVLGGARTRSGVVTASIAHAAPEILDGRPSSQQSDVYSLASTLFCLLQGAPAFARGTDELLLQTVARVLSSPVPDLRERGVPAELCGLLEWAMAKHPGGRPTSALAFGEALRDVQRVLGLRVTDLPLEGAPGHQAAGSGPATWSFSQPLPPTAFVTGTAPARPPRRKAYVATIVTLLAAAAVAGTAVAAAAADVGAALGTPPAADAPPTGLPSPLARPNPPTSPVAPTGSAGTVPAPPERPTAQAPGPADVPTDLSPLLLEFTDIAPDGGELDPPDGDISTVLFCARGADQAGKLAEAKRALAPPYDRGYLLYTHVAAFRAGEAQAFMESLRTTAAGCAERYAIDEPQPVVPPPGADEAVRVTAQSYDAIWARRGDHVVMVQVSFHTSQQADRTTAPDLSARAVAKAASRTS